FHMSVGSIGIAFALAGIGNMLGSTLGGRVSDRIGKKSTLLWGGLISAIGVVSIPFLTGHFVLAVAMHIIWAIAIGLG
ncbi:MFS transporter, partial [Frankia sp. Cpl3]|nr:MFS transporter [Frankia sp. Cpl3]